MQSIDAPGFVAGFGMTNLLDERLGAKALACSDDCFASMSNLVLAKDATFTPESFGPEGQIYSGWESGRNYKRSEDHEYDWCILMLGVPGVVEILDIDTSHFRGNFPAFASVEACSISGEVPSSDTEWTTILGRSALKGHCHNFFAIKSSESWSHLRLKIHPDGGVARIRAYGHVTVDREAIGSGEIELSSVALGGRGVAASDMFYSPISNMLWPNRAENMGQGWETARKRGPGHNWAVVALGVPGTVARVVVDTAHFKHNSPESCEIWGATAPKDGVDILSIEAIEWRPVVSRASITPHAENVLRPEPGREGPFTHIRLDIFPDGGVSRLRVFGTASRT